MTEDQEKFWKILSTPHRKDCRNCKNRDDPGTYDGKCRTECRWSDETRPTPSMWEWDGENM